MKTKNLIWIMALSFLMAGPVVNGQITKIQNAKDKITSGNSGKKDKTDDPKDEPKNETNNMDENNTGGTKHAAALDPGKGYFYTGFKSNDYKNEVSIGDDLYVRMELGKTMIEIAQEKGLGVTSWAYGYVTVYIDGNKSFTTKPYSFASNISKVWKYINIPLNVGPDFMKKIESDQSMLETEQDIWVFQQLFQENGVVNLYTTAAMQTMASGGNHTVKVEFGLSDSDSKKEPDFVAATGEVKITVDAAGAEALSENGPKHLRPLKDEEKGKIVPSSQSFTVGSGALTIKLELPNPPKYYNEKWCQSNTCDYDHGDLGFYASLDGEPLAAWSNTFWDANYESVKSFEMVLLPANDHGQEKTNEGFNDCILFKFDNPIAYKLLDGIYGGKLTVGTHKLKIKIYSYESIPMGTTYLYQDSYFSQWPSIAEVVIDIVVTEQGRLTMANSSEAKKLTHAGGDWTAVESTLKSKNSGSEYPVIDVAVTTEWKVYTNSLGAILYRECAADVIYKCEFGYRISRHNYVIEDYSGGGTYGAPYFKSGYVRELDQTHFAVPESKVK